MGKGRRRRKYTWYLEPLDSRTNDVFARELPEENFSRGLRDENGIPRNLWRCQWKFAKYVTDSKGNSGLRFRVFNQENDGKIRETLFLYNIKRSSAVV